MKANDGEAKETGKENGAGKDGENTRGDADKDILDPVADSNQTATNGVVVNGNSAAAHDDTTMGTPTPKGKGKSREIEGGMISPESLEAT